MRCVDCAFVICLFVKIQFNSRHLRDQIWQIRGPLGVVVRLLCLHVWYLVVLIDDLAIDMHFQVHTKSQFSTFFLCRFSGVGLLTPPGFFDSSMPWVVICWSFSVNLSQRDRGFFFRRCRTLAVTLVSTSHEICLFTAGKCFIVMLFKPCLERWSLPCSPKFLSDCRTAS